MKLCLILYYMKIVDLLYIHSAIVCAALRHTFVKQNPVQNLEFILPVHVISVVESHSC